jgi:hypothetical protein
MAATINLLRQTGVLLASKGLEVNWTLGLRFTGCLRPLGVLQRLRLHLAH